MMTEATKEINIEIPDNVKAFNEKYIRPLIQQEIRAISLAKQAYRDASLRKKK